MATNRLKIIDALEINFVDSCSRNEFKLNTSNEQRPGKTKGVGEKRLYISNTKDAKEYDDFFDFDNLEYFFFKKSDLLQYLKDAKNEYLNPTQDYKQKIENFYTENYNLIFNLQGEYIKFNFTRTYDKQNRYYLVLEGNRSKNNPNRQAYSYLLSICLPRVTKINFVKLQNENNGKNFIYLKPNFISNLKIEEFILEKPREKQDKEKTRKMQTKYRFSLLDIMPSCVISGVADDRILIACHIKPFSKCNKKEEFDENNGIILTPTYHYLFDIGFITFDNNGNLVVSDFLSKLNQRKLYIQTGQKSQIKITKERQLYLQYHRENIFQRVSVESDKLIK